MKTLTKTVILALLVMAVPAVASASSSTTDPQPITFYKDIAPLLQQDCQVCHRPDGANLGGMVAPMALTTYSEVRPWAKSIAKKVQSHEMPPWHASPAHAGQFKNERTLTDVQIDTFVRWAKAGAPAGDESDAPEPMEWPSADGWLIGEPDLILTPDEAYFVADDVEDIYVSLHTKVTPEMLPEDRYVKAVEFRPGSSAVHHIIVPGLGGIAPGNDPTIYGDGIASTLVAGQDLMWQMHYHKEAGDGTGVEDLSQVAIKFYGKDEEISYEMQNADLGRYDFAIPPGEANYILENEFVFPKDSRIVAYLPHMHLRGKAAKYVAYYPDGTSEVLLDVPKYDFNWQTSYVYNDYKSVPEGTRVVLATIFDNSDGNPYNPDPSETVRWGEPTTDEMSFGFMAFINEENAGGALFGQDGGFDITAVVAFTDKSRDGKMQLEEAPEQIKPYFVMMDTNKDQAVDMEEARAANDFIKKQALAAQSETETEDGSSSGGR